MKHYILLFLSIVLMQSMVHAQPDFNKPVGATAGNFEVSLSGAATYQIPIYAPPGTVGMQSNISLAYSSQAGMGCMGMGWSISGISMINRVQKDIYHDGKVEKLKFDTSTRFAIDGQRLVAVSGINGTNGAEYCTENESFAKIFSYGTWNGNPEKFEVRTQDGKTLSYGAKQMYPGQPLAWNEPTAWYISKITDEYGNYMQFEYLDYFHIGTAITPGTYKGDFLISKISYTGNANAGILPYDSIVFKYENYNDFPTYGTLFILYKNTLRLKEIISYAEGQKVRSYTMEYHTNYNTSRFFLNKITEYNSNNESYNSTVFAWETELPIDQYYKTNYSTSFFCNEESNGAPMNRLVGDINGDGISDIVCITNDAVSALGIGSVNAGGTTLLKQTIPNSVLFHIQKAMLLDVDMDGKDELIITQYHNSTAPCDVVTYKIEYNPSSMSYTFSLLNTLTTKVPLGSSFENTGYSSNTYCIQYADVTGDGLPEAIIYDGQTLRVHDARTGNLLWSKTTGASDGSKHRFFVTDVTGDGLADFLLFSNGNIWVEASNGSGFDGQGSRLNNAFTDKEGWNNNDHDIKMTDINGDGLADIIGFKAQRIYVSLCNEGGFESPKDWGVYGRSDGKTEREKCPVHLIDIDGDGLQDIVLFAYNGVSIFGNTGKSFIQKGNPGGYGNNNGWTDATPRMFGDFDGDGMIDIIGFGGSSTSITFFNPRFSQKIKTITDGFQNQTQITYQYHNQYYENRTSTITYPYSERIAPTNLVDKITYTAYKTGKVGEETYNFQRPLCHLQGKGFLGFRKIEKTNTIHNTSQVHTFGQLHLASLGYIPLLLDKQENKDGGGSITTTTYQYNVSAYPNKRFRIYTSKETTDDTHENKTILTDYEYDNSGNLSSIVSQQKPLNGTTQKHDIQTINYILVNGLYKPLSINKTQILWGGGTNIYEQKTAYTYYTNGMLNTETHYTSADMSTYTATQYSNYNAFGQASTSRDFTHSATDGDRSQTVVYDAKGRFIIQKNNPLGHSASFTYDAKYGNLSQTTDANGLITQYIYDNWGKIKKTILPDNTIAEQSLNWYAGTDIPNALYYSVSTATAQAPAKVFYDAIGREVRTHTQIDHKDIYVDIRYNTKGLVEKRSLPFYQASQSDDFKQWTTYIYDNRNRLIEEKDIFNDKAYAYSLRKITITDKLNSNAQYAKEYNLLGQLIIASDPGGSISYTYNVQGLPVSISSNGSTTTLSYNHMGQRTVITEPNAGTTTSEYNHWGEIVKQTNANGHYTAYTYDKLGRMLTLKINGDAQAQGSAAYTYDQGNKAKGKPSNISSANHNTAYIYDNLGRPLSQTENISGKTYAMQYQYNGNGQLTKLTYPSGYTVNYRYTACGQLDSVLDATNTVLWRVNKRDDKGQAIKYTWGNDLFSTLNYDLAGNLTHLSTGHKTGDSQLPWTPGLGYTTVNATQTGVSQQSLEETTATTSTIEIDYNSDGSIQNWEYSYNRLGQLVQTQNKRNNQNRSYTYDKLNRLTVINGNNNYNHAVTYDNTTGNILEKSQTGTYGYASNSHAVTKLTFTGINSFPFGDCSKGAELATEYTPFNKIQRIASQGDELEFAYGNDQQRISSQEIYMVGDVGIQKTTIFANSIYEEERLESYTSSVRKLHYIPIGKLLIIHEQVNVQMPAINLEKTYFVHLDRLGSYDVITDAEGVMLDSLAFDAWGNRVCYRNWNVTDNTEHLFSRGFTGHEHLDRYGIINMNGRLYDPVLARFFSPDPFVQAPDFTQGFNRYSYCMNNPLMFTDPSGELFGIFSFIMGYIHGFTSTSGRDRWNAGWQEGNKRFNNHWNLVQGLWTTDRNKSNGERAWELFSRFTWQAPQTFGGFLFFDAGNTFTNKVHHVETNYGMTAVDAGFGIGAVTIGNFSGGPRGYRADWRDHTFVHEYGHYVQSQQWGPTYLPAIGIPSILSAMEQTDNPNTPRHHNRWFEADASYKGMSYFDKHYGSNKTGYVKGSPDYFDKESFVNDKYSPYENPRGNGVNYWGNPIKSKFHWTDIFNHTIGLSPLFLLLAL